MAVLSRQALRAPETFDAWLEAAGRAVAALPNGDLPACPNCGRFDLQVRFVADPATRIGFLAMWSEFCGHGIRVSRVQVPAGATYLPTDASAADLASFIPSFTEIAPSGPVVSATQPDRDVPAKVLRLLARSGELTKQQIAEELGVSRDATATVLDRLLSEGLIAASASDEDVVRAIGA